MSKENIERSDQALQEHEQKEELKQPPLYSVLLLNDDYTPMDFVVEVLSRFFGMNEEKATDVMLAIHYKGKANCGVYTAEVAETKVDQVSRFAQAHEHPLLCVMEQA